MVTSLTVSVTGTSVNPAPSHARTRNGYEPGRWASEGVRGEVTIVVEGAAPAVPLDLDDDALARLVQDAVATGLSRKDAVSDVAARTGVPRKQVYAAAHR